MQKHNGSWNGDASTPAQPSRVSYTCDPWSNDVWVVGLLVKCISWLLLGSWHQAGCELSNVNWPNLITRCNNVNKHHLTFTLHIWRRKELKQQDTDWASEYHLFKSAKQLVLYLTFLLLSQRHKIPICFCFQSFYLLWRIFVKFCFIVLL